MKYLLILIFYLCWCVGSVRAASPDKAADQVSQPGDAFQRGLTALKENRLEDALVEFSTAEREHPDDARVHNFRGILLVRNIRKRAASIRFWKMPIATSDFSDGPNINWGPPECR